MVLRSNEVVDATAADLMLEGILERIDNPDPLLRYLAGEILDYEAEVFATAGFGTWSPLDPDTILAKGSSRILVDDGDLLADLTSARADVEISGDTVTIATDHPAAEYLKRGARGMPKRDPAPEPPPARVEKMAEGLLGFIVAGRRR